VALGTDVTGRAADLAPQQVHILNLVTVVDIVTRGTLYAVIRSRAAD